MDEPPDDPDATEGRGGSAGEHRMPGWVKGFVIAGILVAAVVLVALLIGRGDHGPERHGPGDQDAEIEAPDGHTPPADMDHG